MFIRSYTYGLSYIPPDSHRRVFDLVDINGIVQAIDFLKKKKKQVEQDRKSKYIYLNYKWW